MAELLPGCVAPFYSFMVTVYANYLAQSLQCRMNPSITKGLFWHMVQSRKQNLQAVAIQSTTTAQKTDTSGFTSEIFTKTYPPYASNPFISASQSTPPKQPSKQATPSKQTSKKLKKKTVIDLSTVNNTKVISSSPLTRMCLYDMCMISYVFDMICV